MRCGVAEIEMSADGEIVLGVVDDEDAMIAGERMTLIRARQFHAELTRAIRIAGGVPAVVEAIRAGSAAG